MRNGVSVTSTGCENLATILIVSPKLYVLFTEDDVKLTTLLSANAPIIIFLFRSNAPAVPDAGKSNEESMLNTVSLIEPKLISMFETLKDTSFVVSDGWTRYSNVYPVMKVTLDDNKGDGPSIDAMVAASKEFVDRESQKVVDRVRKTYQQFMGARRRTLINLLKKQQRKGVQKDSIGAILIRNVKGYLKVGM